MTLQIFTPEQDQAIRDYLTSNWKRDGTVPQMKRMCTFNIFLCGTGGTGKSRIAKRLCYKEYSTWYDPIGNGEERQVLKVNDIPAAVEYAYHSPIDTGGGIHYHIFNSYAKEADAFFLIYAVSDRSSFERLEKMHKTYFQGETGEGRPTSFWKSEAWLKTPGHVKNKPIWVMATKNDLPAEMREVPAREGEEFAKRIGARLKNVSSKMGEGLQDEDIVEIVSHIILHKIEQAEKERKLAEEEKAKAEEEKARDEEKARKEAAAKRRNRWSLSARLRSILRRHKDSEGVAQLSMALRNGRHHNQGSNGIS